MSARNLLIAIGLVLGLITYFNYSLKEKLSTGQKTFNQPTQIVTRPQKQTSPDKAKPKNKEDVKITYKLTPSNPEDYGFISHDNKLKMPKTVEGWEIHYRKVLKNKPVFEGRGGERAIEMMKTNFKDYQGSMNKLEEHIAIYEKKRSNEPLDKSIEEQLQNLYRLKALGKVLKESVVVEESDFVNPLHLNYIQPTENPRDN